MGCGASVPSRVAEEPIFARSFAARPVTRDGNPHPGGRSLRRRSMDLSQLAGGMGFALGDPLAATRLGITLAGLAELRVSLRERFGEAYETMSTADVNREWVMKVTQAQRCRLLELEGAVASHHLAPPMYFISHAWKNRVALLLDSILERFLANASTSVAVWVDILSVNQHDDTEEHSADIAAFDFVVRACSGGTIVVMDVANCNPATRGWCVYEWAHTLAAHGPDGLHMSMEPEERAAVFRSLDIRKAQCQFPKDKGMILAAVERQHGSAEAFNAKLRLQLLLEPLSYRVDLHRLTERASGTTWTLGAVASWLEAGAGGSRVLCVSAGDGEGKSTISAVLASDPAVGGFGDRISAHHFLKYNDQRRLEPVRMIKSLAFQLALRIKAFADSLLKLDAAQVARLRDPEEAFRLLLLHPLEGLTKNKPAALKLMQAAPQVVLLIDALDEADPIELQLARSKEERAALCPPVCGNKALQLIIAQLPSLPPWVRFIFTTRPEAAGGQVLPCLARAFSVTLLQPSALRVDVEGGSKGVMVYHTVLAAATAALREAATQLAATLSAEHAAAQHLQQAQHAQQARTSGEHAAEGSGSANGSSHGCGDGNGNGSGSVAGAGGGGSGSGGGSGAPTTPRGRTLAGGGWPAVTPGNTPTVSTGVTFTLPPPDRPSNPGSGPIVSGSGITIPGAGPTSPGSGTTISGAPGGTLPGSAFAVPGSGPSRSALAATPVGPMGLPPARSVGSVLGTGLGLSAGASPSLTAKGSKGAQLGPVPIPGPNPHLQLAALGLNGADSHLPTHASLPGLIVGPGGPGSGPGGASVPGGALRSAASQSGPEGVRRLAPQLTVTTTMKKRGGGLAAAFGLSFKTKTAPTSPAAKVDQQREFKREPTLRRDPTLYDVYKLYGDVFSSAFQLLKRTPEKARMVEDLLAVLTVAKEPLSQSFLQQLGLGDAIEVLPGAPTLFFVDEHHLYTVHKSLTDWLLNPAMSGPFAVDTVRGHERLGLHLSATWRTTGRSIPYTLKYVVPHLAAAASPLPASGRRPSDRAAAVLDELLCDFAFFAAVAAAGHTPGVIAALGALSTQSTCTYDALRWLRSEQHHLVAQRELTPAGAAAQAWSSAAASSRLYERARRAAGQAWRTARVLPTALMDWPGCHTVLKGSSAAARSVAFSPDGKQLANGGDNARIYVWDAATGQCTATLRGHTSYVNSVTFSPDGKQLASGSDDRSVRLWDAATGQCTAALTGHTDTVWGVTFSPNNKLLASGSDDQTVRLWVASSGAPHLVLQGHTGTVWGVSFGPDGKHLASGSDDRSVKLWDTTSGACLASLTGHAGGINSVSYSPDGKVLASGSDDHEIILWDAHTLQRTATLEGHSGAVWNVSFCPDGRRLASGSEDEMVRVWDTASGLCTGILQGHSGTVWCVAFSPDGGQLASVGGREDDNTTRLWDAGREYTAILEGHTDTIWGVSYSPDGRLLASGSEDKTVRLWDAGSGQCISLLEGHLDVVGCVAFHPTSRGQLASGGADFAVRLWETPATWSRAAGVRGSTTGGGGVQGGAGGHCLGVLQGHSDLVCSVSYSPTGDMLASGSADETVRLWDVDGQCCVAVLQGHSGSVCSVAFSPDGQHLASGSWDNTVRIWDLSEALEEAVCTAVLQGHLDSVWSVAYNPDGGLLASGSFDNCVRLWDTDSGTCSSVLEGHTDTVLSVSFRPDGKLLASGSDDKSIRLWEVASGACVAVLLGHSKLVHSVAWRPVPGSASVPGEETDADTEGGGLSAGPTGGGGEGDTSPGGRGDGGGGGVTSPGGSGGERYQLASSSGDKSVRVWEEAPLPLPMPEPSMKSYGTATSRVMSYNSTAHSMNGGGGRTARGGSVAFSTTRVVSYNTAREAGGGPDLAVHSILEPAASVTSSIFSVFDNGGPTQGRKSYERLKREGRT
ncbi:hypothetical protein HYH03_009907 [Edaphochlamys debaryana]|uniref:Nephrocystin 3-like N-terminal domain-containing protein n=1 Tax=Edaphochlamys debaryana TaxID=47281 RepID=A0A835XXR6_9CHLO|nr:hypothetical protein HYH03_009907 [Edaphochlamys debaryana]|eukprot:KAG2491744.1 hypothetical protein HYH03_009907 [Edaphochlamys debaryana]